MTLRRRTPEVGPLTFKFPPLPEIRNKQILAQVFTHRSLNARPTHIFEDSLKDLSPDNERFEHLGDSVLGMVVTDLMLQMYPGLRVGSSTKMRAIVVGNTTLAEVSQGYNLMSRLKVHPAQAVTLHHSKGIHADVFEAFVGGLYTDQGIDAVRLWLAQLFPPYIQNAYSRVRSDHGLPPSHLPPATLSGAFQNMLPTPLTTPVFREASQDQPTEVETPLSPNRSDSSTTGHLALFNQCLQKDSRAVEWHYYDGDGQEIGLEPGMPFGGNAENVAKDLGIEQLLDKFSTMVVNKTTPVWTVSVYVDGEYYGAGQGNTKKAARNEAAKFGLKRLGFAN